MDVADFDFELPEEQIAQEPLPERDGARLLVLDRGRRAGPGRPGTPASWQHRAVRDLPGLLRRGDLLVVNDARVIPARLRGHKQGSGGKVEILLVEPRPDGSWFALGQASKPLRAGAVVDVGGSPLRVRENHGGGELTVELPWSGEALWEFLDTAGELPLPPYLGRAPAAADAERYQTIFARARGAIAAPTAGLHFTPALLDALREAGAGLAQVTLHVGPGTFLPVRATRTEDHRMHRERYEVPEATAAAFARTRAAGGRVVAVGTTALRTLEAAWDGAGLHPGPGSTDLFCTPGYQFRAVDALFTNFHLPKSTLLMLVAAFAGLDPVLGAYREAVATGYRFFSYGDAMLIV